MTNTDYHASPAISASGLKELAKSPWHYKCYKESPAKPSAAMTLGTAIHCAILEPERFESDFIVVDRRTKEGKQICAEFTDKTFLSNVERSDALTIAESVKKHPLACQLLRGGEAERSIFWNGPMGIPCRCRPDYLRKAGDRYTIVDIKTTGDVSEHLFARSAYQYGYHIQAAFYTQGCRSELDMPVGAFAFIAVETSPPYPVQVYIADDGFMSVGHNKVADLLALYKRCSDSGEWPLYGGSSIYSEEARFLRLPKWAN